MGRPALRGLRPAGGRDRLAPPLRPLRLDHPLLPDLRVEAAQHRLPVFHYGILFVLAGHLLGLFVPASWTDAIGVTAHTYHLFSLYGGTLAGAVALAGIALLVYRRRTRAPVFRATTANDKVMYLVLVAAIVLGMWAKVAHSTPTAGYEYRDTIAPGPAASSASAPTSG